MQQPHTVNTEKSCWLSGRGKRTTITIVPPATTVRRAAHEIELHRLRVLYQLLADLARAESAIDVYETAITSLLSATEADRASILFFDDDGVMQFTAWRGLSEEYRTAVAGHTPWRRGELGAQPLVVPDVRSDDSLAAYQPLFQREGIRALAFVPLALNAGVLGKFMLYYAQPHEFGRDELDLAGAIANHIALATERKRAELARDQSERRLQAILDNSTTVVFLKDLEGRYILINRRYEELFHVTKAAVVGKTDHDIFPKRMADRFRENDQLVLSAGEALEIEEDAPHQDGVHTYISIKFPIRDANGSLLGVGGIATDVTGRKKTEAALRQVKEGLEQFAYAAAHDLQEPIRNITLSAQLLTREFSSKLDPQASSYIQLIVDGSRRMQMLLDGLLAYARSLEDEDDSQVGADADEVIREVLSNLRTLIENTAGEVTHDPLPLLPIRPAHLTQLLQNLIGNGLKYCGDRAPRLHVSAARQQQNWVVSVRDNGIGVPEKHRERIFRVFKRLHGSEVPGSGIGLAICARIVGHYHGRIWVDSAPDGGSIFSFMLPGQDDNAASRTSGG